MGFKDRFKELGRDYLDAIEGAVGCRLDANYPGKTYELKDLTATLRRFYAKWSSESAGLVPGHVDYGDGLIEKSTDFHLADEIEVPLRQSCKNEAGIFIMMRPTRPDRVRSLLMFADAILFWDPLEEAAARGVIDGGVASLALSMLIPLRPLIAAGLVVPAQVAQTRVSDQDEALGVGFPTGLMWQGALGMPEFENRLTQVGADELALSVPEGPFASHGWLGHAENKVASMFLPDIVIPLMDYDTLSSYQKFCESIDGGLKAKEVEYVLQSLAFETGFLLDPEKLTNDVLLDLRDRDAIFAELRSTIIDAVASYEDSVATGHSASFIDEFNARLAHSFRDLKAKALISNTWKEFVDESKSLSSRFLVKSLAAPLTGKGIVSDWFETLTDASVTSVGNIAVASLKTYTRYRNTKVLMDLSGAIRENFDEGTAIEI